MYTYIDDVVRGSLCNGMHWHIEVIISYGVAI